MGLSVPAAWFHAGFVQVALSISVAPLPLPPGPAQRATKAPAKEKSVRGGKEALRGFMASSSLHGLKIMTCEEAWKSYGLELCTLQ